MSLRQGKVGQGYKFSSVGSRFKRQLGELMEALHTMEPHYIRCIKPNSFNRCPLPCPVTPQIFLFSKVSSCQNSLEAVIG